jgi:hypothetical protein
MNILIMQSYMIIVYYSFLILKNYLNDLLFKTLEFYYSWIVKFLVFTIFKLAKFAFWKWITIFNGITIHHTSKIF